MAANNSKYAIDERRRQVASMLAKSMTEAECAQVLGVSQPTISNDIKALKEKSRQFVYDLAKNDISYFYKQKLDSLEEVKRQAWLLYNTSDISTKEKLLALKIIVMSDETSFKLLNEGPGVLSMLTMENRLSQLESETETGTETNVEQ